MNKQYILLDLDGTLTDSMEGITNSVTFALKKFNINVTNLDELKKFIGPPLKESFMKYYNFTNEEAETAIVEYRKYFSNKGIFENKVYNNIEIFLNTLYKKGKTLIIATSKPTVFAERILKHFDLKKYFSSIIGSTLDGSRVKKEDVIAFALKQNNITDLSKAIMIGDREHDIVGAKKANIESIGVLYGYGNYEELYTSGANYIVKDVDELLSLFN